MFRWTPEATDEQKQQVAAELRRLPGLLPVLRAGCGWCDGGLLAGALDWPQGCPAELPFDSPVPCLMVDEVAYQGPAVFAHESGGQVRAAGRRGTPGEPAQALGGDLAQRGAAETGCACAMPLRGYTASALAWFHISRHRVPIRAWSTPRAARMGSTSRQWGSFSPLNARQIVGAE